MNYNSENNKNGFTLIELLAVIVILAVIALIAVPIIMDVINDAKKGSAKDSMYSYVKAVELSTTRQLKPDTDLLSGTYTIKDGDLYSGATKVLDVELKGTRPVNGVGTIDLEKGQVISADLKFDDYCIKYDGETAENKDNCSVTPTVKYSEGTVIYYNPETNKKCTASEVNTIVNAKTGCLKWNIITMGDTTSKTTVDIMLDHNTTAIVEWNSSGNNAGGMLEVATALQTDVSHWNDSIKGTARLITGKEVADIAGNTIWTINGPDGHSQSILTQPWLYQNTFRHGDNTNYGYWTSTAHPDLYYRAWSVDSDGFLENNHVGNTSSGVRPVIRVLKSNI